MFKLKDGKEDLEYKKEETKQILDGIVGLDRLVRKINKKGVSWNEYLEMSKKEKFPLYRIKDAMGERYIYTEKELKKFRKDFIEKTKQEQKELALELEEKKPDDLWELKRIRAIVSKLEKTGLNISHYDKAVRKKPINRIKYKDGEIDVFSFDELLEAVKNIGRKKTDIQRYKGLGEMNPSQLWETTMDPEKRVLLQVKLEDIPEANLVFTTLMGDKVEPRRNFIQKHALEVKNLDI